MDLAWRSPITHVCESHGYESHGYGARPIQEPSRDRNKQPAVWVGLSSGSEAATIDHPPEEEMLVTTAFCTTCQRTVHIGRGDDDGCPVCSTPLVRQEEATWVTPPGRPAPA